MRRQGSIPNDCVSLRAVATAAAASDCDADGKCAIELHLAAAVMNQRKCLHYVSLASGTNFKCRDAVNIQDHRVITKYLSSLGALNRTENWGKAIIKINSSDERR